MVNLRRSRRVRAHFFDDKVPSVEGLLVSRRHREYAIAVPQLIATKEGPPVEVGGQIALVPRENVFMLEILAAK